MMEQLTKREEEVMNKFWEKGEATVKEIIALIPNLVQAEPPYLHS